MIVKGVFLFAWPSPAWLLSQASFPPVLGSDYKRTCRGGGSGKEGCSFPTHPVLSFPNISAFKLH